MPGKYIRCDVCGATFHGNPVDHLGVRREKGYWYGQGGMLRDEARTLGWKCDEHNDMDVCPECLKQKPRLERDRG